MIEENVNLNQGRGESKSNSKPEVRIRNLRSTHSREVRSRSLNTFPSTGRSLRFAHTILVSF